jgi:hypothetical protein
MPFSSDSGEERFDAASSRLNDGLRSCRAVLSNYRALLAGDGEVGDQAAFTEAVEEREPQREWRTQ